MSNEKTALRILQDGRYLISVPKQWTKDAYARDADGWHCDELGSNAVCWCSYGALIKVSGTLESTPERDQARDLLSAEFSISIAIGNDHSTHAEMLAVWDRAIEEAKVA